MEGGRRAPRNVTPGAAGEDARTAVGGRWDPGPGEPGSGGRWGGTGGGSGSGGGPGSGGGSGSGGGPGSGSGFRGPGGPGGFEWSWPATRPGFPWLGVLLVLIGAGLALRTLEPRIGLGDLLVLAVGLAFVASWLVGRSRGAMVPGLVLVAFALAGILRAVGAVSGEGWTALLVGAALLVVWVLGRLQGGRHGWALWLGALLLLYGLTRVSDQVLGLPDLGLIWPVLIIGAGLVLIAGSARGRGGRMLRR